MTIADLLAVALALLSAAAFAVATVAQQDAAARSTDADARALVFIAQLLRRPRWWAGTLGNGLGYALQAGALVFGSLLLVQPLVVVSLLFALPLGARAAHRRLSREAWIWGTVLVVSLATFVGLSNPNPGGRTVSAHGWLVLSVIAAPLLLACVSIVHARTGAVRTRLLAIAVGLLAGLLALLTKSVVAIADQGAAHVLASGQLYALVIVGVTGIYLQQLAFQSGPLHISLPIIAVLEPMSAVLLGYTLLREQLDVTGLAIAVLGAAAAAMTLATVRLARDEATVAGAPTTPLTVDNPALEGTR